MMKKFITIVSIFVVFTITSLIYSRTVISIKPVIKKQNYNTNLPTSADFKILEAVIIKDILRVQVEFTGKNPLVELSLYWDGSFLKSLPMRVNLHLHVDSVKLGGNHKWKVTSYFNIKEFKGKTIHLFNVKTVFKTFSAR